MCVLKLVFEAILKYKPNYYRLIWPATNHLCNQKAYSSEGCSFCENPRNGINHVRCGWGRYEVVPIAGVHATLSDGETHTDVFFFSGEVMVLKSVGMRLVL